MKNLLGLITIIVFFVAAQGCKGKIDRPDPVLTPEQIQQNQAQTDNPIIPSGAVATSGVKHYTCPNGHEGSDLQGACVVCGTTLVHNQAYHNQPAQQPQTPPAGAEPPQNALGVWHYTCPNGHEGGAGSAVACATCGATLAHNTAYHDGGATTTSPLTADPSTITPPPSTPEPPQNAAGVWHYTCPNGHEGGGGSATPCAVCGTTLAHNQAYHN